MTNTITEKLIYYRLGERETELISESDLKRIEKVWGKPNTDRPYNRVEMVEEDQNYGTGLHIVTELMSVIQCDRRLNERSDALEQRIKKGLTRSKAYGVKYVEENLLLALIQDAKEQFLKDGGNLREAFGMEQDDKKYIPSLPYKEFFRLFGVPYKSVMDEVKECEEKIGDIPKPKKLNKINYTVGYIGQCDSYKLYSVKGTLSRRGTFVKTGLPYVGKVYQGHDGFPAYANGKFVEEKHIQIYVYDQADRDWALQNVVNYLLDNQMITLK